MCPDARGRALVIDSSPESTTIVRSLLEREGFDVVAERDGRRGVESARARPPELVILDVTLPDTSGVEVCRELRRFTDAYVVMLTARDREVDKVVGLAVGADDYVTKPFSPPELVARVRAMRRRPRIPSQAGERDFGRLVIDAPAHEVRVDGAVVDLTRIEFAILELLSSQPRRTVTRQRMLTHVWGDWYGDDHTVEVHMAKLRRKIGESAAEPGYLRTVRGLGYRFDPV